MLFYLHFIFLFILIGLCITLRCCCWRYVCYGLFGANRLRLFTLWVVTETICTSWRCGMFFLFSFLFSFSSFSSSFFSHLFLVWLYLCICKSFLFLSFLTFVKQVSNIARGMHFTVIYQSGNDYFAAQLEDVNGWRLAHTWRIPLSQSVTIYWAGLTEMVRI